MAAVLLFCWMLLLELWNKGTGGRCDCGFWKAIEEVGAEFA